MGRNRGYTGKVTVGGVPFPPFRKKAFCGTSLHQPSELPVQGHGADNLLMGKPAASDEELWAVLSRVNLAAFLKAEQGLDTRLLEKASNLSGGQCQRHSGK